MCPRAMLNFVGEELQVSIMVMASASRGGTTVFGELRVVEGEEAGSKPD